MRRLVLVAVGGAGGAGLRWALAVGAFGGAAWPASTLAANLVGAFGLGLLLGWLRRESGPAALLLPLLAVGLFGALTTMSTFALELVTLWRAGAVLIAATYGVVTVGAGLGLARVGLWAGSPR